MELDWMESMMVLAVMFIAMGVAGLVGCLVEHFVIRSKKRWLK